MSDTRRYTDEQYLDAEYFLDDDENTNVAMKIVKTRTPHECSTIHKDFHPIAIGTRAICESAINSDIGRVSNYLCLDCADEYLDEIHGE